MNVKQKGSLLAGLAVLLFLAVPAVSAFEISGTYTEEGQQWLNEHWGENITNGDLQRIAYDPEDVKKIEENVDPKTLEEFRSQPHYWGDRYPPEEVLPGCKIVDDEYGVIYDTDYSISNAILNGADDDIVAALMEKAKGLDALRPGFGANVCGPVV
ncbi:hypothetical protein FGU65_13345 [Methanoculleus sp. FWC-SCC1]|uniref:Uncharacterized protein n=1 Tax=Methanoculleus frigidifontis TaxID=2584085 RepID=A0ABT8MD48_9EURY|nr:hypothetical protein [Methanoculleus sp. FWC-SCC1]MDN7025853.1 hypothetical protein [Methanoculleus sp. FWC-SCC1]